MPIDAPPRPRASAASQAADTLRARILAGAYRAGESLPGERDLADELGVSRLTLRAALAHLEAEGLVLPVHGSGTRVLDFREVGGLDLLGHLARLALTSGSSAEGLSLFASLLELRRSVAVEAVALATERASRDELRAMRAHVASMHGALGDAAAFMAADLGFARRLVRATKNLAFELLFNSVARTLAQNPGVELAFHANAEASVAVYARLLDRMEARDPERARATAARLVARLDRTTLDALGLARAVDEAGRGAAGAATSARAGARAKRAARPEADEPRRSSGARSSLGARSRR